jgi:tRNA (guanine-N7-)-methyltransferase
MPTGRDGTGHSSDLRSFGRRRGRKVSPRQRRLLEELLPKVRFTVSDPPVEIPRDTWLEIGFGGGEHLVWQAAHNPHVTLIGCEPFEDGIVKVLAAIEDRSLSNVAIHPDDARPLLRALPEGSIARIFILFPDPWPKKRHAKRRLVSPETLALVARVMRSGAELRIATDIGDYARITLAAVRARPEFAWVCEGPASWRQRPDDWPQTRYEAKAIREGRLPYFFTFLRR